MLPRKACCLAGTFIDLYFSKGGMAIVDELHSLGLACLLLANKLTDNYLIPVNHQVFPQRELNIWEEKVCLKLSFRLSPLTHVEVMDYLLTMWNVFAGKHKLWSY